MTETLSRERLICLVLRWLFFRLYKVFKVNCKMRDSATFGVTMTNAQHSSTSREWSSDKPEKITNKYVFWYLQDLSNFWNENGMHSDIYENMWVNDTWDIFISRTFPFLAALFFSLTLFCFFLVPFNSSIYLIYLCLLCQCSIFPTEHIRARLKMAHSKWNNRK